MNQRKPAQTFHAASIVTSFVRVYFIVGLVSLLGGLGSLLIFPGYLDQFVWSAGTWLIVGIGMAVLGHGYTKKERTGQGGAVIVVGWIWLTLVGSFQPRTNDN